MEWYAKGAELGNTDCMLSLAFMYEHGKGVKKDLGQAVEWYTKAAQYGQDDAQIMLERKKINKYLNKNL